MPKISYFWYKRIFMIYKLLLPFLLVVLLSHCKKEDDYDVMLYMGQRQGMNIYKLDTAIQLWSPYKLDLDINGTVDFSFVSDIYTNNSGVYQRQKYIKLQNSGVSLALNEVSSLGKNYELKVLKKGNVFRCNLVNDPKVWSYKEHKRYLLDFESNVGNSPKLDYFPFEEAAYLVVKIDNNGVSKIGWLKLQIKYYEIVILECAVQK